MQAKFSFSDKATGDKYAKPGEKTTPDQPETTAADTKLELDMASGETKQVNPEDSTGMGAAGDTAAVTGSGTPAMHGSTKPAEEADASGTAKAVAGAMGMDANPIPDNPLPVNALLPESITGLPSQQVGAIDLADGKASGEAIRDESRRVKSYESSATIVTSTEALRLAPGSVIAIAEACFDNEDARSAFAKEWRLSSVSHSLQSGKLETQLSFYTPQAQKPPQPPGGGGAAGASMASVDLKPGELIWPMKLEGNSVAGLACEYGHERGRLHAGIDFGGYGAGSDPDLVFASAQGQVIDVDPDMTSGYGRLVDIQHANGIVTRYAHLLSISVEKGAEVQQGQKVGIRGGSGASGDDSYAYHLHFEVIVNGSPVDPRTVIARPGPVSTATGDDNPRGNAK
jgi:murein DD-endopeptidase MepM/ murein hydrolase activator NlpD